MTTQQWVRVTVMVPIGGSAPLPPCAAELEARQRVEHALTGTNMRVTAWRAQP